MHFILASEKTELMRQLHLSNLSHLSLAWLCPNTDSSKNKPHSPPSPAPHKHTFDPIVPISETLQVLHLPAAGPSPVPSSGPGLLPPHTAPCWHKEAINSKEGTGPSILKSAVETSQRPDPKRSSFQAGAGSRSHFAV